MLYFPQTRIELSVGRPVAAGSVIAAEGAALVTSLLGGVFGVKASTGAAGEVLAGVSVDTVSPLLSVPKLEEVVVEDGKLVLSQTPIGGTVSVVNKANNVLFTSGVVGATTYDPDEANPRVIAMDASHEDKVFLVAYRFAPSMAQALSIQGNTQPGGPAGQYLGDVGVITRGDVFTDQFDTSGNWATAVGVKLGANGLFVAESNAANCIRGVQIIELPSAARAFLGLNINAAV